MNKRNLLGKYYPSKFLCYGEKGDTITYDYDEEYINEDVVIISRPDNYEKFWPEQCALCYKKNKVFVDCVAEGDWDDYYHREDKLCVRCDTDADCEQHNVTITQTLKRTQTKVFNLKKGKATTIEINESLPYGEILNISRQISQQECEADYTNTIQMQGKYGVISGGGGGMFLVNPTGNMNMTGKIIIMEG